jgi:hypothetical protein
MVPIMCVSWRIGEYAPGLPRLPIIASIAFDLWKNHVSVPTERAAKFPRRA